MTAFSNITISAPAGTSQHGRQDFLCLPVKWYTVLVFFIANYLSHAFTLWKKPGETALEYTFAAILALLFPIAGTGRGLDAIYRHASWQANTSLVSGLLGFGNNDYEKRKAAKSGALAIVVREHVDRFTLHKSSSISHFEYNGENWHTATLRGKIQSRATSPSNTRSARIFRIVMDAGQGENPDSMDERCNISGLVWLHEFSSYRIMELPSCNSERIKIAGLSRSAPNTEAKLALAQSSSLPQILIAIFQIIYASYTLAKSTGDEIERNGYASFHLTVIPYIIMSFVNLLGNLATPTYPCVYLVGTSTIQEAQLRGNVISGYTGWIPDEHLRPVPKCEDFQIQRVDCRTTNFRHQHVSHNPRSTHQRSIEVCFKKHCPDRDSHGTITVASGKPSVIRTSRVAESIFKYFLGLPCIIATPIIFLIYVSKRNPTTASLQTKVLVWLWYAVGDLIGILLLYYRDKVNVTFLINDIKIMLLVLQSMYLGSRFQDDTSEKRKEYMRRHSKKPGLLVCGFVGGLGVAGWNFWHVAVELIRFGDCRALGQ